MLVTILAWLCLFFPATVHAGGTAYEDTLSGKTCTESRQQLNCEYKVGKDLEFSIDGIGMPDTGITFVRSDYPSRVTTTRSLGYVTGASS